MNEIEKSKERKNDIGEYMSLFTVITSNKRENDLIKNESINNNESSLNEINNDKNNTIINNNKSETKLENKDNKREINLNSKRNKFLHYSNFKVIEPHKNNKINLKTDNSKYIFPKYYYFIDVIFDNLIYPKKLFCLSKTYFIIYNFMCQVFDISTYIMLYKHNNIMSNMLKENSIENNGYNSSNLINRINISDSNKIEKIQKDLKNRKSIVYSNYFL